MLLRTFVLIGYPYVVTEFLILVHSQCLCPVTQCLSRRHAYMIKRSKLLFNLFVSYVFYDKDIGM